MPYQPDFSSRSNVSIHAFGEFILDNSPKVAIISILTLVLVTSFFLLPFDIYSAPDWKNFDSPEFDKDENKQKGKAKKESTGDTMVICHRPPANENASDTAKKKEFEMVIGESAWKPHKKHGDKKGPCRILSLVKTISDSDFESSIRNFQINKSGELQYLLTKREMKFFDNGELVKTLPNTEDKQFIFSVTDTSSVLERTGVSHYQRPEYYSLYGRNGQTISTGKLPSSTIDKQILFGHHYLSFTRTTRSGQVLLQNLNTKSKENSKKVWSKIGTFFFQIPDIKQPKTLLMGKRENIMASEVFLVDVLSGKRVSPKYKFKKGINPYNFKLLQNGKLSFVIGRDISNGPNRPAPLYAFIFNHDMEKIAEIGPEFQYLKAGEFLTQTDTSFFVGGSKSLIEKNITSGVEQKHIYPIDFEVRQIVGDSQEDLLFLSGFGSGLKRDKNPVRKVLVYDVKKDTFPETLEFNPEEFEYNLSHWGVPSLLNIQETNLLVIRNPTSLRFYNYER